MQGDIDHTAFDNLTFATSSQLTVVEDRGDTLHTQHNALESGCSTTRRARRPRRLARFLAEERDASAAIDSTLSDAKTPGFRNDGNNEITGIHVSDGDPSPGGILGAKDPLPFANSSGGQRWRVFWTEQHGDNVRWEIIPRP